MKRLLVWGIVFTTICLIHMLPRKDWNYQIFKYDVAGYYLYLPATFIYHDLGALKFYPHLDSVYDFSNKQGHAAQQPYGIFYQPKTSLQLNKYPLGLAIGELPFFLAAHIIAATSTAYPADGYSVPYRIAICFASPLFALLGLFFLSWFLDHFTTKTISIVTVSIIGLGTNLFCYSVANFGMSHAFLFAVFSFIMYCTVKWQSTSSGKYFIYILISLGLVLITRPTDFLVAAFPLFWIFSTGKNRYPAMRPIHLVTGLACFTLLVSLQLLYWKWVTGEFLHFSYEGEWFDFRDPEIMAGLFSYRKGWFLYTPIAGIAFLGIPLLYFNNRKLAVSIALYFLLLLYVTFSWHEWWYGWSFGCRPMIEHLAVLSIPLASFTAYILRGRVAIKMFTALVISFMIWLNIYQTNQYLTNALPGNGITKAYYWRAWNRMHVDEEDRKLLW
jgi:hypothetical protein